MKITTFLSVNNENLGAMAPKFALFTKGSKLPLNKGFKNMFELNPQTTLFKLISDPNDFNN